MRSRGEMQRSFQQAQDPTQSTDETVLRRTDGSSQRRPVDDSVTNRKVIRDFGKTVRQRKRRIADLHARLAGLSSADDPFGRLLLTDASTELLAMLEELKTAEEELRRQNEELASTRLLVEGERERYRLLFDLAPVPLVVTDDNGMIREANREAETLFQVQRMHLLGKPITSFVNSDERTAFRSRLNRISRGLEHGEWGWTVNGRDGVECDVVVSIARPQHPINNEGLFWVLRYAARSARATVRTPAVSPIIADERLREARAEIDRLARELERERAEREEADAERRGLVEFLGIISHELRTPMQAMLGYTDFLGSGLHGELNDEQHRDVDRVAENLNHAVWLLTNVLDYSQLGAGSVDLNISAVPMQDALEAVRNTVTPICRQRKLTLEVLCSDGAMLARADRERLHQVLVNLVMNAAKFSPMNGEIRIDCTGSDNEVLILISDKGPGIPEEAMERIFEPFVRLPGNLRNPGAGLGLPISRDLARRMGGDLGAVRGHERGAAFLLRLPRLGM